MRRLSIGLGSWLGLVGCADGTSNPDDAGGRDASGSTAPTEESTSTTGGVGDGVSTGGGEGGSTFVAPATSMGDASTGDVEIVGSEASTAEAQTSSGDVITVPASTGVAEEDESSSGATSTDLEASTGIGTESTSGEASDGVSSGEASDGVSSEDTGSVDGPSARARAEALLAELTLAEKIGQMTLVAIETIGGDGAVRVVSSRCLGGVLGGGDARQNPNTALGWADHHDRWQQEALSSCARIPLLYGVDAVHGNNKVEGAVIFPHNIGLGATRNPALVERVANVTAVELAATGVRWTFSPAVSVPRDEHWGRTYEGFSEDTALTADLSEAAVVGLQGRVPGALDRVAACAKHYLGDGGTNGGVDRGETVLDEATLRAIHLPPFERAIEAGVLTVMASFNTWNGVGSHEHRYLLTDVLKGELGFQGIVTSDWGAIDALPGGTYADRVRRAIDAGIDMVMVPQFYDRFIDALTGLVERGDVSMARIDDAVTRILTVKFAMGLFDAPYARRDLLPEIGSAAHREVARQAVRESMVLLKNEGALPLSDDAGRIAVVGTKAAEIGSQCGGWTLSWQGSAGDITPGTTILEGIEARTGANTVVQYSPDGRDIVGADVAVVVVGENPYAEWLGDRTDLSWSAIVPLADREAATRAVDSGVPVVLVLISGRPLVLTEPLAGWNALLAAWLPGTEGSGVVDVLFGDHPPSGRLPHSWPAATADIPVNAGEAGPDPLFPLGFGLTYP